MECPVCFDAQCDCKLVCGHNFCQGCVKSWYLKGEDETTCPMCRRNLYFRHMRRKVETWEEEKREYIFQEAYNEIFDVILDPENLDEFTMYDLLDYEKRFNTLYQDTAYEFDKETLIDVILNEEVELSTDYLDVFREYATFLRYLFISKYSMKRLKNTSGNKNTNNGSLQSTVW
jgi:hypothetical protein